MIKEGLRGQGCFQKRRRGQAPEGNGGQRVGRGRQGGQSQAEAGDRKLGRRWGAGRRVKARLCPGHQHTSPTHIVPPSIRPAVFAAAKSLHSWGQACEGQGRLGPGQEWGLRAHRAGVQTRPP